MVATNSFQFEITAECTSLVPTAILISGVIAWPSKRREKLAGVAMGLVALFAINLIRIITLFYVGSAFPGFLDIAHYFIWQTLIVVLAIGLWLGWTQWFVSVKPGGPPGRAAEAE